MGGRETTNRAQLGPLTAVFGQQHCVGEKQLMTWLDASDYPRPPSGPPAAPGPQRPLTPSARSIQWADLLCRARTLLYRHVLSAISFPLTFFSRTPARSLSLSFPLLTFIAVLFLYFPGSGMMMMMILSPSLSFVYPLGLIPLAGVHFVFSYSPPFIRPCAGP